MENKRVKDMTKGNPAKLLLQFTIPLLIGNVFQQLYNMVDSIVVGNFVGENALGAIGTVLFLFACFRIISRNWDCSFTILWFVR